LDVLLHFQSEIGVQNINVTRAYNFGILQCMLYKNVYAFITDSYTESFSH